MAKVSTVTVYGSSDDLIEVEGSCAGCDEYNGEDERFVLTGENGDAVRLRVAYVVPGVWAIAVSPVDEDEAMLPVAVTGERYTAKAVIENVRRVVHEAGVAV